MFKMHVYISTTPPGKDGLLPGTNACYMGSWSQEEVDQRYKKMLATMPSAALAQATGQVVDGHAGCRCKEGMKRSTKLLAVTSNA